MALIDRLRTIGTRAIERLQTASDDRKERHVRALYDCVQKRPRPEDVAELVLATLQFEALGNARERMIIRKAAAGSMSRDTSFFSSMKDDFARPTTGLPANVKTAAKLLDVQPLDPADAIDPAKVEDFIRIASARIGRALGDKEKMTRAVRHRIGIHKNARWFNKRWRLLVRMERKLESLKRNERLYLYTRVSKSGLAVEIPFDDFAADVNTACFVAYYTARQSLRSTFTSGSQTRAFDEVSATLLARCAASPTTRWDVIACTMPDAEVVRHLTDEQKGVLLGRWWDLLTAMAKELGTIHAETNFDRAKMIVSKGDDSTTWNQVAGAWNKAREQWVSILHALGADDVLDVLCPGKVMRLMAADVAYLHRRKGGDVHPDTVVWSVLPPPWQVVTGDIACTRAMVTDACRRIGVDPASWVTPRAERRAVAFTPTPELVHGVAVTSPGLALVLRKAGVFSGKAVAFGSVPANAIIERDEHGAALRVSEEGDRNRA